MTNQIELIKQLLDHVDDYIADENNTDLKQFSFYLKDKMIKGDKTNEIEYDKKKFSQYKMFKEVEFSSLLTGLYRFAKHYTKKAFKNTNINTLDEFGFLASLLKEKSMLKKDLINQHLLEMSSGSEILKRLLKNKMVEEHKDENDGRAKRVSLTAHGVKEIMNAFDDMHKVSTIVIGPLDGDELDEALSIFNKLHYFHKNIHEQDRLAGLQEIKDKYLDK